MRLRGATVITTQTNPRALLLAAVAAVGFACPALADDPIADAVNAARERGTETVVAPPRTPPRIEIAPSRTSTPPGELPACDSVEAALILARITNSPLSGIKYSKALGANDGKNICAATISGLANQYGGNQPATYTIEWLDRKAGRYWVQLTG